MERVLSLMKKVARSYFKIATENYAWRYTGNTYISQE